MSYGVHKVPPVNGTMWEEQIQSFCDLEKGQEKGKGKKTIIPANCWNHDWRSK